MLRKSLVGAGAVLASVAAGGSYQPVRSHDNTTPEERQMRRLFEAEGIHAVLLVSGASSAAPIKLGTEPSALEMKVGENGIQFLNISSATSSIYLFEDGVDVGAIGKNVESGFKASSPDEKFTIFWDPSIRTSASRVLEENKGDLWIFTTRDGVTSAAVKERNGRIEIQCRHNPDSEYYVTSFTAYPTFFGQDERIRKPGKSPLSPDVPISVCLFMLEERNLMLASVASLIDIYGGRDTFSQPTPLVSNYDRESFAESVPADSGTPPKSEGSENAGNCKLEISVEEKRCVNMVALASKLLTTVNNFRAEIVGNTLSCSLAVGGGVFANYTFLTEAIYKYNLLWYGYSSKRGKFEKLWNKRETVDPLLARAVCAELDIRIQEPVLDNVESIVEKECSNAWVGFPGRADTSLCIDPSEDIQGVTPNSPLDTQLKKVTGRTVSDHPRVAARSEFVFIQCFNPERRLFINYFAKKHSSVFNPLLYRPAIVSRTGRIVKRVTGTERWVDDNVATRVCQHLFLKSTNFDLKPENGDCAVKLFRTSRKPEEAQELSTQSICLDLTDKPDQFETGRTKAKVEAATVDKDGKTVIKCGIDHTGAIEHGIAVYTINPGESVFALNRFNYINGKIVRVQDGVTHENSKRALLGFTLFKRPPVDPKIALRVCAILANRQRDLVDKLPLSLPAKELQDSDTGSVASTAAGSTDDGTE